MPCSCPLSGGFIEPLINSRDFTDPALSFAVVQGHNLLIRPMQVIRDEGYLLVQQLRGVARQPPRLLISTSNFASQTGHATPTRLCPFSLIWRYTSCRYARSAENSPSMTFG